MKEAHGTTPTRSQHMPSLVLGLVLLVLAGAIALTSLFFRRTMRHQIIQQDGYALLVSSFVQESLLEGLPPDVVSDPTLRFADLTTQMFETAMRVEALAITVFDVTGDLQMSWPMPARSRDLTALDRAALEQGRPVSSFEPAADMREFGLQGTAPVLRALLPLKADGVILGATEFVLDGNRVAAALRALDRELWRYAWMVFVVGGAIITLSVLGAYRRLSESNRLLAERTRSLLRANHELTLAAKTSAVGAIATHLIHDLKSPLFGLQSFVRSRANAADEDWDVAIDTADRMQKVIAEIVRILQEEKTTEAYELSGDELLDVLRTKLAADAEAAGVGLVITGSVSGSLSNRDANIILLVISNLVHNAIQATPREGQVTVLAARNHSGASFEVSDTGCGLSAAMQQSLFMPCRSRKPGGTGLGLAISRQLANHLGADLRLKGTSHAGTTFELLVPERVFAAELIGR